MNAAQPDSRHMVCHGNGPLKACQTIKDVGSWFRALGWLTVDRPARFQKNLRGGRRPNRGQFPPMALPGARITGRAGALRLADLGGRGWRRVTTGPPQPCHGVAAGTLGSKTISLVPREPVHRRVRKLQPARNLRQRHTLGRQRVNARCTLS